LAKSAQKSQSDKKKAGIQRAATDDRIGESLKIGDVARRLGSLLPWCARGEAGLGRPTRTDSRYRIYKNEDLKALRRAVYLRRVQGMNALAILRNSSRRVWYLKALQTFFQPAFVAGSTAPQASHETGEPLSIVAEAVGVSIGFLSNLERSQSEASVGIMRKLAQYYGLNIWIFFNPIEGTSPLVRPEDRRFLEGGPGVQMELLASGKITMEPHLFRVAPGRGAATPTRTKERNFSSW